MLMSGIIFNSFAMASASVKLDCIALSKSGNPVGYDFGNAVLKIGDELFDLNKLMQESVSADNEFLTFGYSGVSHDLRTFAMLFDAHGRVDSIVAKGKADAMYSCKRPR